MEIRVPVSRRSTWGSDYGSERYAECVAKLFTSHPHLVRLTEVASEVENGLTVEYAVLEVDPTFPEDEGFIATQWTNVDQIVSGAMAEGMYDIGMVNIRHVTHSVECNYGNAEALEGRDFPSAFNAWLDEVSPQAIKYLETAKRTSRRFSLAALLRRIHCWSGLANYLKLRGIAISKIGERVKTYGLDERTYGLTCWTQLAPVRIAQALGFAPTPSEPEPWVGIRDAQELQIPHG